MNSYPCWQGIGNRFAYTCRYCYFFFFTLLLSFLIINPSFADKDITNTHSRITAFENTSSFAQTITMPVDTTGMTVTISDCDAENKFMDDGFPLYQDDLANPRRDTVSICPNNEEQTLSVQFIKFDVANLDTLIAYDGDLEATRLGNAPLLGKSNGVGPSNAFGSWVQSSCSPAINPSGCISFVFKTNGDLIKSTGWEAWVSCTDRNIVITPPALSNPKLKCDEFSRQITIPAATITASCGTIENDTTIVRVTNASGQVCTEALLSKRENTVLTADFALGTYIVTYKLKSDSSKTAFTFFSINPPNLTCNNFLNIPLGTACGVEILPDMILENVCDTISGILYYQITIRDFNNKIIASGTGRNGDYPSLTNEQISKCSNQNYSVEVKRVYFEGANLSICNNGVQETSCTAIVNFEDNSSPIFGRLPAADTLYNCDIETLNIEALLPKPISVDNCTTPDVSLKNTTLISSNNNSCDGALTYLVAWLSEDGCGNQSTLTDTLRVIRPGIDKILDAPTTNLSCGEDDGATIENFQKTGLPSVVVGLQSKGVFVPTDTIPLSTKQYVCNYILQKQDQSFPSTCGTKYFRYWTLLDWCDGSVPIQIDTQLIQFKDTIAPTLLCTPHNSLAEAETISFSPFDCNRSISFPKPLANDNCDAIPIVEEFAVERLENAKWWKLADGLQAAGPLESDTFRVGFRAYDLCPEQVKEDTCYRYFILEDDTKPTAICQDLLNISLSNDFARITANDIDEGSWDACGIERVLIRRSICGALEGWDGPINPYVQSRLDNKLDPIGWAEFVNFNCCDMYQRVKIELLVIDVNGNYNFCWTEVEAVDKISPICVDLPDQWDYCDNFHNGELGATTDVDGDELFDNTEWLSLEGDLADTYNERYGTPFSSCVDNLSCQDFTLEQQYQLIDLECGVYKAKRRYRARDWSGNVSNWAEQSINVEYRPDWRITLPVDWTGDCGDEVPTAELIIDNGSCDLMSYEHFDQKFEIVNDACFKVIRTYHIINWCKYQAGDEPVQLNRLVDSNGDVIKNNTVTSYQYGSVPYFTYVQILKVVDSEAPTVTIPDVDECIENLEGCSATKTFAATATDCNESSNENLEYAWEVFENNISVATGAGQQFDWLIQPSINYQIKWKVSDRCGNFAWATKNYFFRDCTRPAPYCLDGLAIELGDNQQVDIWAADFNLNSSDNCTNLNNLDFRIWHQSLDIEAPANLEEVQNLPTGISLTCTHIGTQQVHIYVIDEAQNYDFCITNLQVQDNMGVCPVTGGQVTGRIYTEFGASIPEVEVSVSNEENNSMMTPLNGSYSFDLSGSSRYVVQPKKDVNMLNGVSTFDMVKMTKHILGKERFTSPYQYIAADINASGDISTFDIIQLRKLILNLSDRFPDGNTSWRFVDANYEFTAENPLSEAFPEYIEINGLSGEMSDLDFIGIKIGDINGSVTTSGIQAADSRTKEDKLIIKIEDQQVTKGSVIDVPFEAAQFAQIDGFQFTLAFEGLKLIEFTEGLATTANFGFHLKERGYLTSSWNNLSATNPADNPKLFSLTFEVMEEGYLSSFLKINSEVTQAEAYRSDGALLDVKLQGKEKIAADFQLGQNTPNPFDAITFIPFSLPEGAEVSLKIMDLKGRILYSQNANFRQGAHKIKLAATDLANGTYYYQLTTPFGVQTKKLVVLR